MSPSAYLWVLLASTFLLSALWAAVLLVLVRVDRPEGEGGRSHMGVELAWAVIPVILVLSVVLPTLQSGPGATMAGTDAEEGPRVAEVAPDSGEPGGLGQE